MSTIKSSDEHLTLNADGTSKDIKFQANGVEKASISSAGAFTSTTIDATKLTGTIPNFTSTGIDDNADATAMTISSSEKVRVGATNDSDKALLSTWQDNTDAGTSIGGTSLAMAMQHYGGANSVVQMGLGYCNNHPPAVIGYQVETNSGNTKGDIFFATRDTTNDVAPTERFRITVDGRGLSQFTAKAWAKLNGTGTPSFYDSHNCSSITDNATGSYTVNFTNNTANNDYAALGNAGTTGNPQGLRTVNVYSYSTSGVSFGIAYVDGTGQDVPLINIAIFGD